MKAPAPGRPATQRGRPATQRGRPSLAGGFAAAPPQAGDRPVLQLSLPIEEFTKYAGLIGLVTATFAVTGVFASVAYLSAWRVPAPVVRLDPLTAALRSETVVYQFLTLALIVFGLDVIVRRLASRPRVRAISIAAVSLILGLAVVEAAAYRLLGPVVTVGGGVGLVLLHHLGRVSPRGTMIGFVLVALASAYQTGAESGRLVRDDPAYRLAVNLTTRSQVGGLGGTETGFGWTYGDLYLVFRDGESLYVARGSDPTVWVVPAANVMSLGIGR